MERWGITTSFHRPNVHTLEVHMDIMKKELLPTETIEVKTTTQYLTAPYLRPKSTIDYIKVALTRLFPYLTAPVFFAKI